MLDVGGKEEKKYAVSVRSRFKGDEGQKSLADCIADIKTEIDDKINRPIEKDEK